MHRVTLPLHLLNVTLKVNNMSNDKRPRSPIPNWYSRGKLGESFFRNSPDFDLSDPNIPGMTYNDLHDPHLKAFFYQPERKQRLINQGLITHDNKVLCTLGEYKRYEEYLGNVDLSWEKCFHQELRDLLKEFMVLKLADEIPDNTTCQDMRDWILQRGEKAFRSMLEKTLDPTCNLNVAWEVSHRDELEKLEQEIIKELQLEQKHHLKSKNECSNERNELVVEDLNSDSILSACPGPSKVTDFSEISKEFIIESSEEAASAEFTSKVEKTSAGIKTEKKRGAWAFLRRAWKGVKRAFSRTRRTKISPAD